MHAWQAVSARRCTVCTLCLQIGFERLPESTVQQLIEEGDVMWCAGGLMVEHPLVAPHITYMHGRFQNQHGSCITEGLIKGVCQKVELRMQATSIV